MNAWISFWSILIVGSLAVFAGMVIMVTVNGLTDIRDLFRTLKEQHTNSEDDAETSTENDA